jgi:PAS domain S-box-containing protein
VQVADRIALVSAQTERLFGYQRDELPGEPAEILVPEVARKAHRAHQDRTRPTQTAGDGLRDGALRPPP